VVGAFGGGRAGAAERETGDDQSTDRERRAERHFG
jgi:hypothetical protein